MVLCFQVRRVVQQIQDRLESLEGQEGPVAHWGLTDQEVLLLRDHLETLALLEGR